MLKIASREYKVMLRRERFGDVAKALKQFHRELESIASSARCELRGRFDSVSERRISFFDTKDRLLGGNEMILRRRTRKKRTEYTLKCRSRDRYLAAAAIVKAGRGLEPDEKFEEDIGPPFASRFSHSNTVEFSRDEAPPPLKRLGDAARLFPGIKVLCRETDATAKTKLRPVNAKEPIEHVYTGPAFRIGGVEAEIALIVWFGGDGEDVLLAEFSFRYKAKRERFSGKMARAARTLYEVLQKSKWANLDAETKTQFMFDNA